MLQELMAADLDSDPPPTGVRLLTERILDRAGPAGRAVLFYGSCRRNLDPGDGLVDLLLIVNGYRAFHGTGLSALANWLLPPSVYYLEATSPDGTVRSKYAVVSLAAFRRRTRGGRDAYFWARFAQPCRIAWARDEQTRQQLAGARAAAARRFARKAAPLLSGSLTSAAFWSRALAASYRCELRPEPPATATRLVERDRAFYRAMTPLALDGLGWVRVEDDRVNCHPGPARRTGARLDWAIRRVWGKLLNVLRLFKAAGTFTNGIDYLVWKVERHSGVRIEPTEGMRRHPRLAAWGLAWKLWRKGAFR